MPFTLAKWRTVLVTYVHKRATAEVTFISNCSFVEGKQLEAILGCILIIHVLNRHLCRWYAESSVGWQSRKYTATSKDCFFLNVVMANLKRPIHFASHWIFILFLVAVGCKGTIIIDENTATGCFLRPYSYNITKRTIITPDNMALTCSGTVTVQSCWGRCDTSEVSASDFCSCRYKFVVNLVVNFAREKGIWISRNFVKDWFRTMLGGNQVTRLWQQLCFAISLRAFSRIIVCIM